ncbi:MAG: TetM/TetW/TetO/TetS family tetracycline resistance ribosomal protection protein, partial [Oscillospiraceae bacterium]|nr:TetM/TetW/TetO/TetS family tetracycline resistance ribosomal protection protein [Oscillospiraceae bacterium]
MYLNLGLLAHVDAGKTTLSEAMLYRTGARRTLGRVDHRDAFLDTHDLERQRGITIFSKQARFATEHLEITLVDTPGHADFGAEAERTMPILDCAVLIISGTDGVQAHTVTLWNLLRRYRVPVIVFVNKQDLPGKSREAVLAELAQLDSGFVDFDRPEEEIWEAAAMCDESLLEEYLTQGSVSDAAIRDLIGERKLFPCCFGSALKLDKVDRLLEILDTYAPQKTYGEAFSAQVYKISYDPQGTRLSWLKVTGGVLRPRMMLTLQNSQGEQVDEKILQLRLYSGDKFTTADQVLPGQLCAVTGLTASYAGQGLGAATGADTPIMEPVMTYRLLLPDRCDPVAFLPKLRLLEEEDPQLRIYWDGAGGQIHVQIMGKIQLEILKSLIQQRFNIDVSFDSGRICYKETIAAPVEGVGHFEPLRHYAEVHILLEPLPAGSGLVFDTQCSTDVLDGNYQRMILSVLEGKQHLGVLTGSPITDMKLTLLVGRAHVKHTEGGDFRQATCRAVRQGLMQAESLLLEPWYDFTLTVPMQHIGRAITDIRSMGGEFDTPETVGEDSQLKGILPASELKDYADTLASYTQGTGRLQLALHGYLPCHNTEAVLAERDYNPEA